MSTYKVDLREWRRKYFDGKPPAYATLKRHLLAGRIPGEEVGTGTGIYVVHCDAEYNPVMPKKPATPAQTGNSIADAILSRHAQA